jgi:hypothetical protein
MTVIGNGFPESVLPVKTELFIDGTWTDITSDVRGTSDISITRGRGNERSRVTAGTCVMTLNNRDGKYSNRNPMSEYYGFIGRNTPVRTLVEADDPWLLLTGTNGDYVSTTDKASLDITSDIDVRIDIEPALWTSGVPQVLISKYAITSNQRSWRFRLLADRTLEFAWSEDGTNTDLLTHVTLSTVPVPSSGRIAVRVTLDVNNGSGGNTTTFYTADTIDDSWTQLGSAVIDTSGTTSIFSSTAILTIGSDSTGTGITSPGTTFSGKVYAVKVLNGIAGTEAANPNFRIQTLADTSFTDTATTVNTWTVQANALITNRFYRFHGEVSAWPQRWDTSGTDVYTPIEAGGILRRLAQGTKALKSPLFRTITGVLLEDNLGFTPYAYWPLDDGINSSHAASGLLDGTPMTLTSGTVNFAADESLPGGDAHPEFVNGVGFLRGAPPEEATVNGWKVAFWMKVNASSASSRFDPIRLRQLGTATVKYWAIETDGATNAVTVRVYADDGTLTAINPSVTAVDPHDGEWHFIELEVEQTDSNEITARLRVDGNAASEVNTAAGLATNDVDQIDIYRPDGTLTDVSAAYLAHLTFYYGTTGSLTEVQEAGEGYPGETVGDRLTRLCGEQEIEFRLEGLASLTSACGPQPRGSFLEQVYDAVDADMGILYEPRDFLGLAYRTRVSLLNQFGMELNYTSNHLSGTFEPTEDDQLVVNDVTAKRKDGSSYRLEKTTGPLSVSAPPDGVGRYELSTDVNVEADDQLRDVAGWLLGIGTWDEARFPSVTIELHRSVFTNDDALMRQAIDTDVGDYISVDDPPSWLPPDLIELLSQGVKETLSNKLWTITYNCVPYRPYTVGVFDTDGTKYDSAYSTLNAQFISGTNTSMSVAVAVGRVLWVTGSGAPQFPFDINVAGARLTVTAISGASSPQTFTITQTPVNGVAKTIPAGTQVRLWKPARYSF